MYRVIVYKNANDTTGQVLHEPKNFGNKVLDGSVDLLFNGVSTASFTIAMDNSLYRQSEAIANLVKVVDTGTGKAVFDGRIVKIDGSFSNTHTQVIQAEDCLAYLHDSTQVYRKVQNTSIRDFLQMIIDTHNSQVESWKQFKLGSVTVTNSTDNVYRFTDDATDTFDTIKDKLISRLGGFLIWHRDDSGQLVLDYLSSVGEHIDTPIKLGKNLKSAKREYDVRDIITRLVPVGATIQETSDNSLSGDSAQPHVTIESVNSGVRYLSDSALENRFGIIQKAVSWNNVNVPSILMSKGQDYLTNQRVGLLTWTVDVVDISLLDDSYKTFDLGNYYPIRDDFINVTEELQVVEKKIDITRPHALSLKIGTQNRTFSQYQLDYQASINYMQEQIKQSMQNNTVQYYDGNIIDVSEWQKTIDWQAVVGAGLGLAIVRVQYGSGHEDLTYKDNIKGLMQLSANYAVYSYMTAGTATEAVTEATNLYNRTQAVVGTGKQPRFYMIDVEAANGSDMRGAVESYMNQLNSLGVPDNKIVLYVANQLYTQLNLNVSRAGSVIVPAYRDTPPDHDYDLWQYTSTGSVSGITGNVDMSKNYSDRFKNQYLRKE
ncbi:phage tail spike protein [Fructobacillus ficulneus]|uniref:Prophage Lp1 protein 52, endolysin n=1 Tax=Fructobacillus ficulneus TaxID=157463 RepID=A0A0K8MI11_9LACO|nr:phage tail spike protein [Fructobacillus ficulneus]GAO99828.1 prophage Lp1 protein 52, endolysin [Fructobacillus ficulneus]